MEKEKKDDTATLTAQACECSASYVRLIVNGKRSINSDKAIKVLNTFNKILDAKDNLSKPVNSSPESAN